MNMIKVFVSNLNEYIEVEGGEELSSILQRLRLKGRHLCALVNNKLEALSFQVFAPKMIEFLPESAPESLLVYTRSLCMMLFKSVTTLYPGCKLMIEHSVSGGYLFRIVGSNDAPAPEVSEDTADAIRSELRRLQMANLPFERHETLTSEVIEIMKRQHLNDKVTLLETINRLYTIYYTLDGLADTWQGPLAPHTGCIDRFDVQPSDEGFLLSVIDADGNLNHAGVQPKMAQAFANQLRLEEVLRVKNAGELNLAVKKKKVASLINVAEAMHEKQIATIASRIAQNRKEGKSRFVFVAGPSSSGKTTSAKRLAVQLMTELIQPKIISLDDYFIDREHTPRDASGDYDFESLYALDLQRLNADLTALIRGEEINLPSYSFELGKRVEKHRPLRLADDEVLVIEGIHGLNPHLINQIDSQQVFKVYVSALTTMHIDNHNWISTSDNRLLRRIVRDYKYRGTSAYESIRRWPSVRRGEQKWIFPFQENADAMFNSSLLFEIGVMKPFAEPLLREVPHSSREYADAYRLLRLLSNFETIPADQVPPTSLLREFLGGSSFKY